MLSDPELLETSLWVVGAIFLLINLQQFYQYWRFRRIRASALVTWTAPRPPLYRLFLWVGALLGVLIVYKLAVLHLHPKYVFGETMMLIYYVYVMPMSLQIRRGFYEDGIWTDGGYMPYSRIGGLTWREGAQITLVLLYRWRTFARRLLVPEQVYGEARRVLRDKIAAHDIHFTGKTFDLGMHDERDDV
ncbi:MAG TPA: hypothetical protein VGL62_13910 [Vicinamibacterales bacterium]|jgi:hypothetical protein